MTMRDVDDGMIKGVIQEHRRRCDHCGTSTTAMVITGLDLRGLEPSENMIVMRQVAPHIRNLLKSDSILRPTIILGIGCGCYGKANRQLAYMKTQYADTH